MKKIAVLTLAAIVSLPLWAQEKQDTVKVKLGNYRVVLVEKEEGDKELAVGPQTEAEKNEKPSGYFSGIDVGFSFLGGEDNPFENSGNTKPFNVSPGKSLAIDINFLEIVQPLGTDYVTLVTGASFGVKSYTLQNNNTLWDTGDSLAVSSTGIEYEKNKLRNLDLSIPLMINFNTSKNADKNFHIAAGVEGSFIWRSIYKTVHYMNDTRVKTKEKGQDYSVNALRADAVVRLGFRNYTLFASYPLTPLFDKDVTAQAVSPVTIGLQVLAF